jgi:N-acetylneuraminic acid mutarotase
MERFDLWFDPGMIQAMRTFGWLAFSILLGVSTTCRAIEIETREAFRGRDKSEGPESAGSSWQRRSSFGPGRILHSAIWTYSEMIVWGGGSEGQFYQSGGIYDPITDRWRPTTEAGAPTGRWGHAAVWTGSEMIVWGGRSSFTPARHFRDGAIYDPRTDRWRPMTLEGAPSGRSQMAAVWTGNQLLVWGGWTDGGSCPVTGAAYDPRMDQWTELPTENAPEGRIEPSCVWTGREMIVWGGLLEGEQRSTATGGRYNPETRKWTLLPTAGAPEPARGHSAIWTGREMLVWGGAILEGSPPVNVGTNAGGIYSPEQDRWRPLPGTSKVEGRLNHVAAWTEDELIIWGGGDQRKGCLSSGGCFNPQTGGWRPIPQDGSPSGRSMATAVWTGDGLLIYGGSTGGSSAFDETYYFTMREE